MDDVFKEHLEVIFPALACLLLISVLFLFIISMLFGYFYLSFDLPFLSECLQTLFDVDVFG
jgi:hypothetical protein